MMAVRVSCPFCHKALKFRQAPAPGRRVLCPGCDRSFPVQPGMVESIALAPASAPPAVPPPDPRAMAPLPSSVLTPMAGSAAIPAPPPPPTSQPNRNLLIGGVIAGLAALVLLTGLGLVLASRYDRGKGPIAAGPLPPGMAPVDGGNAQPPILPNPQPPVLPADSPRPQPRPATPRPESPAPPVDRGGLPPDIQELVNQAIDRGVAYLKQKQLVNGTWENAHTTGMAALPALTLLECGVPASDERVQKSARFVRSHAAIHNNRSTTYEVSLALLFLDRLGDAQDKALIRTLAMRLVAGQLPDGGWTYTLPVVAPEEQQKIVGFLTRTRPPRGGLEGFPHKDKPNDDRRLDLPVTRKDRGRELEGGVTGPGSKPNEGGPKPSGSTRAMDGEKPGQKDEPPFTEAERKKAHDELPELIQNIPAIGDAVGKVPPMNRLAMGQADNSNTQFATLAMWAARKHDLPLERSLALLARRFRTTQAPDGGWRYHTPANAYGTPAMTGAGLLGLAVGHGVSADPSKKSTVKDEQIDKGLKALGAFVGKPLGEKANNGPRGFRINGHQSPINLYFLWTVERVGVLYGVRELDGKDWYRWGVEQLVPTQTAEGTWHHGNYHGSTKCLDTCFALLFLKRANLAADLSGRLDFMVEGKPAAK